MHQHSHKSESGATSTRVSNCHYCGTPDGGGHTEWCAHFIRPIPEGATGEELFDHLMSVWEDFRALKDGIHNTMRYEAVREELWLILDANREKRIDP